MSRMGDVVIDDMNGDSMCPTCRSAQRAERLERALKAFAEIIPGYVTDHHDRPQCPYCGELFGGDKHIEDAERHDDSCAWKVAKALSSSPAAEGVDWKFAAFKAKVLLLELAECPVTPDTATYNQVKGIDSAPPYQAVVMVSCSWTRWKKVMEYAAPPTPEPAKPEPPSATGPCSCEVCSVRPAKPEPPSATGPCSCDVCSVRPAAPGTKEERT